MQVRAVEYGLNKKRMHQASLEMKMNKRKKKKRRRKKLPKRKLRKKPLLKQKPNQPLKLLQLLLRVQWLMVPSILRVFPAEFEKLAIPTARSFATWREGSLRK